MSDAPDLRIEWTRLVDVPRAQVNSRLHDLDGLSVAVDKLGFTTQLQVDELTGELVWGHGRLDVLEAKKAAGEDPPEGIRVDADGEWLAPVVRGWSARSKLHAAAVREADNLRGEHGRYDEQKRYDVLSELAGEDADLFAGTGASSELLDRLLESAGSEPDLGEIELTQLAPGEELPTTEPARLPETSRDEQWEPGSSPDEGSTREDPDGPGPLDVEPAWRTLEPLRARYHDGTVDGADRVMRWLRSHAKDVHVEHDLGVSWATPDGVEYLPPGKWVTRDGQTGQLDVLAREEFDERYVAANEPARRAMRDAKPVTPAKATVPATADMLRHGTGVLIGTIGDAGLEVGTVGDVLHTADHG